jgi:hypothetical protein
MRRKNFICMAAALTGTIFLYIGNTFAMTTDYTPSAEDLVNVMLGSDVTASNVTLTCASGASGTFADGETAIGFEEGIILSSGDIANVIGPNNNDGISANNNTSGDADLETLIGEDTNDACVLEFDFQVDSIPGLVSTAVSFEYVFASDEYNEYVDQFNDVFAFFVNGENIALIPDTYLAVSIDNVNQEDYSQFYINNDDCQSSGDCPVDTQMDGLTTVLTTAAVEVTPGEPYRIKLAIADALDSVLDSNVFIKAGSFTQEFADADSDGIIDPEDNCIDTPNPEQEDADNDGIGDACDACPDDADNDADADGICGDIDNCPLISNENQLDFDADGLGDECDDDDDNDGVVDADDQCLETDSGSVVDSTGCSIDQICPCENNWKNHGGYVKCVAHASEDFLAAGLITDEEKDYYVSTAAHSECGRKK